jgi:hypothetical protein
MFPCRNNRYQCWPRILTAVQYEQQNKGMVAVSDGTVRILAEGITAASTDRRGRPRTRVLPGLGIAPWLQRTMGLRIRKALAAQGRFQAARRRHPLPAPVLAGQRERPGAGTAQAPQSRRLPRHSRPGHGLGHGRGTTRRPAVPPSERHPLHAYSTAATRFGRVLDHLGISGVHTHSLRHQFASEALDANPRELANISQVLGHDKIETTLRFYIHPSANAEHRIGAMMNTRWTAPARPGA